MIRTEIRPIYRQTLVSEGEIVEKDQRGRRILTNKKWGKTKFPGSVQILRPKYSDHKKCYPFHSLTEEDLQKLVKEARLKYLDGPKKGEYITEAFVQDKTDPFFEHDDLVLRLSEGSGRADLNHAIEAIMIDHLKTRGTFRMPDQEMQMAGVRQQYEIVDKDFDKRSRNKKTQEKLSITKKLAALSIEKKRKICSIIGTSVTNDTESDDMDTILYDYIHNSKEEAQTFSELCDLDSDKLNLKFYISKGRFNSPIRIRKILNGSFIYNGEVNMGRSLEDVELFLMDPENASILQELME